MKKLQLSPLLIIFISFLFFNPLLGQKIDESYQPIIKGVPLMYGFGLQDDGKVLLSGNMHFSGSKEIGKLIRVNPDATIDSAFNPPEFERQIINVSINKRGHTIVYGSEGYIKSINKDGSINENFQIDLEGREFRKILLAEDSTFLISSFSNSGHVLERIDETGKTIDSFDKLILGRFIYANTAFQLADGRIAISGNFETIRGEGRKHIIIINNDGTIDNTFKTGTGFRNNNNTIKITKHQGKILAYGYMSSYNGMEFPEGAIRLNLDGTIDSTFSSDRISLFSDPYPEIVIEDNNGKLLVLGRSILNRGYYDIFRYNEDGSADNTFNRVRVKDSGSINSMKLFVDDNNILHLTGWISSVNDKQIQGYAEIDPNGNVIEDFDLKLRRFGKVNDAISLKEGGTLIRGVISDIDTVPVTQPVIKLKKNGTLDPSFNPVFHEKDVVSSFAQLENGDILLGGYFYDSETRQTYLLRKYDSNYNLIKDFVVEGHGNSLNDFDIQENGDIIISGNFWKVNGFEVKRIAKLKPDGRLDENFNQNNILDDGWNYPQVECVGVDKIVVGGTWWNENRKANGRITLLDSLGNKVEGFTEIINPSLSLSILKAGKKNNFIFAGQGHGIIGITQTYLYQYYANENYFDSLSISGNAFKSRNLARFYDALFLDKNTFLLGGLIDEVNKFENHGITKIDLNGKIDRFFDFNIEGEVFSIVRDDDEHVIAFGEFNTVNGKRFNSGVRIKLTNAIPGAPSQTTFEVMEDSIMNFSASDLGVIDDDDTEGEISIIYQPGENYTVKNNTIIPNAEFSGALEVPIQVTDEKDTIKANLSINVSAVNDPPEIISVKYPYYITDTSYSLKIEKSNFNYKDPDNADEEIKLIILEGESYTVSGDSIKIADGISGDLPVKVQLFDGIDHGKVFEFMVNVIEKPAPKFKISGTVLAQNGEIIKEGVVKVYQIFPADSIALVQTINLNNSNTFEFEGVENNSIVFKVIPNPVKHPNLLSTYTGNVLLFADAGIIELDSNKKVTIKLFEKPGEQHGNSTIRGIALKVNDNNGGRISRSLSGDGKPIPNLLVHILDKNENLTGLVTTNSNGYFQFKNLETGTYKLVADYENKPIDQSNSIFEITQPGQIVELYLNIGDSLSIEVLAVITGKEKMETLKGVNLYPNPASEKINISINNDFTGEYEIKIIDILGKVLFDDSIKKTGQNFTLEIEINDLPNGVYFLNIGRDSSRAIKRFLKF